MRLTVLVYLIFCVLFNSGAHIVLKYTAQLKPGSGFWAINLNPMGTPYLPVMFFAGACGFALSIIFYTLLLRSTDLSIAFSVMTSLNFIVIILYSVLRFKDKLEPVQYFGLIFIFVGLFLVLMKYDDKSEQKAIPEPEAAPVQEAPE